MKIDWVKWKNYQGASYKGKVPFNPPRPYGTWDSILGVVARCEGNYDTVISWDNSALTFGFQQWTFTSGRLQKLLESFKSIPAYGIVPPFGYEAEGPWTLFDDVCCTDAHSSQIFETFDFKILGGKFFSVLDDCFLDPSIDVDKKRIVEVCMGRAQYEDLLSQKGHALRLAECFANIGAQLGVAEAQINFAKAEFQRALKFVRKPLGDVKTIDNLLAGTWETPAPALFFNLFQNNPGAAFKLFLKVKKSGAQGEDYFDKAWRLTNKSTFGNWGWKAGNKSPRVVRIKKAMKEFYDRDLAYYK